MLTLASPANICIMSAQLMRMDGRAVECNGLENRRGFTSSVSSNLTPSAIVSSSLWQQAVIIVHHGQSSLSLYLLFPHTPFLSSNALVLSLAVAYCAISAPYPAKTTIQSTSATLCTKTIAPMDHSSLAARTQQLRCFSISLNSLPNPFALPSPTLAAVTKS